VSAARTSALLAAWALLAGLAGCQSSHADPEHAWAGVGHAASAAASADAAAATAGDRDKEAVPAPPPPFTDGIFPCSECHDDPDDVNTTPRELEDEHDQIALRHGPRERWCFDCHNPGDRDKLRLVSGKLVPFEQSYRLCGQCHGPKLRDWRAGVHGKRSGQWNGAKTYRLCVHCHDPHSPRFKSLVPLPAPRRPGDIDKPSPGPVAAAAPPAPAAPAPPGQE
jgi:hypothetical protein